jgi:hypothetical protein
LLCRRFPFAVYYQVDQEIIDIWAILGCRADPENILKYLVALS